MTAGRRRGRRPGGSSFPTRSIRRGWPGAAAQDPPRHPPLVFGDMLIVMAASTDLRGRGCSTCQRGGGGSAAICCDGTRISIERLAPTFCSASRLVRGRQTSPSSWLSLPRLAGSPLPGRPRPRHRGAPQAPRPRAETRRLSPLSGDRWPPTRVNEIARTTNRQRQLGGHLNEIDVVALRRDPFAVAGD